MQDLSWLLTRGYAATSALKLVGDRYSLRARQRDAVMRCSCPDSSLQNRQETEVEAHRCRGSRIAVDAYNVLIAIESALGSGVILKGRDGCYRDVASLHGTYKAVEETLPALKIIGSVLSTLAPVQILWYIDAPISNSGRLAATMRELADAKSWQWQPELVPNADPVLAWYDGIVASSDSWILDRAGHWLNLARYIIESRHLRSDVLDLG